MVEKTINIDYNKETINPEDEIKKIVKGKLFEQGISYKDEDIQEFYRLLDIQKDEFIKLLDDYYLCKQIYYKLFENLEKKVQTIKSYKEFYKLLKLIIPKFINFLIEEFQRNFNSDKLYIDKKDIDSITIQFIEKNEYFTKKIMILGINIDNYKTILNKFIFDRTKNQEISIEDSKEQEFSKILKYIFRKPVALDFAKLCDNFKDINEESSKEKFNFNLEEIIKNERSIQIEEYFNDEIKKVNNLMIQLVTNEENTDLTSLHNKGSFKKFLVLQKVDEIRNNFNKGEIRLLPLNLTKQIFKDLEESVIGRENIGKALLVGPPGIGKTAVIEEYAKINGYELHIVNIHRYYNYYEAIIEYSPVIGKIQGDMAFQEFKDEYLNKLKYIENDKNQTENFKKTFSNIVRIKNKLKREATDEEILQFFSEKYDIKIDSLNWDKLHKNWYENEINNNEIKKYYTYLSEGEVKHSKKYGHLIQANQDRAIILFDEIDKAYEGGATGLEFLLNALGQKPGDEHLLRKGEKITWHDNMMVFATANSSLNLPAYLRSRFQMVYLDNISYFDTVLYLLTRINKPSANEIKNIFMCAEKINNINKSNKLKIKIDLRFLQFLVNTYNNDKDFKKAFYSALKKTFSDHSEKSDYSIAIGIIGDNIKWDNENQSSDKIKIKRLDTYIQEFSKKIKNLIDIYNYDSLTNLIISNISYEDSEKPKCPIVFSKNYNEPEYIKDDDFKKIKKFSEIKEIKKSAELPIPIIKYVFDDSSFYESGINNKQEQVSILHTNKSNLFFYQDNKALLIVPETIIENILVSHNANSKKLDFWCINDKKPINILSSLDPDTKYAFKDKNIFVTLLGTEISVHTYEQNKLESFKFSLESLKNNKEEAKNIQVVFTKDGNTLLIYDSKDNKIIESYSIFSEDTPLDFEII